MKTSLFQRHFVWLFIRLFVNTGCSIFNKKGRSPFYVYVAEPVYIAEPVYVYLAYTIPAAEQRSACDRMSAAGGGKSACDRMSAAGGGKYACGWVSGGK